MLFGPVVTTEAHLAYAGARIHCNSTAEMSAIVEALSFLGLQACSWCSHGHNNSSHARAAWTLLPTTIAKKSSTSHNLPCSTSVVTRRILKTNARIMLLRWACNMCTVTQGIWEMNVQIMLLRLAPLLWCQVITSPHIGRITLWIPLLALLPATTLEMFRKSCVTLERSMFLPLGHKQGVSVLFHTWLRYVSLA